MAQAKQITDANYAETIGSTQPVLIDFWAEWCGPCKIVGPTIEEIAIEFEGKAIIGKMNVDENSQIPTQHGIRSIPTLLFVKNGDVVDKHVGVASKEVIKQKLQALI